ncbi:MAG: type I DNA topoisomerase [Candidatus Paceibacterota bacterium]
MSKLVIVESPTKAKTISKFLKKGFEVESSMGHIRDLPKSKGSVDIENGFKPKYVIPPKKKEKVNELKKKAKKVDEVILATDMDREGEAIAYHLSKVLGLDEDKVKRIVFHEITESAIKEALDKPRKINKDLFKAQEARRVLDRLFGYNLSELIWKKVRYGLSAGRVQSPALRLIVEREREIKAFNPEDYWVITANVNKINNDNKFILICSEEPRDKNKVNEIVETAKNSEWKVKEINEKNRKRNPRSPFKTSTLQQSASSRYGFSPSRTMGIAQKLYEAGLITYMRTDSISLSKECMNQVKKEIENKYGGEYLNQKNYKTNSKMAQEAHEAIRPTKINNISAGRNAEQKKLYDLIRKRTISSQMKPAEIIQTKIIVDVSKNKVPDFSISGSRTVFDGWLKAFPEAKGRDAELPKLEKEELLNLNKIEVEDKQTQPPHRYSEAGLVKELEKRGIGRPSTYATIMKTLENRGYVVKENKSLKPTDTGEVVSEFLEKNFINYINDSFTANLENQLDEIATGKSDYKKTLNDFYGPFSKELENKKDIPKLTNLGDVSDEYKCPKCNALMVYKLGRNGIFMSCSTFPDCKGVRTRDGKEIKDDEPIGKHPETGENIYVLQGPYGPYVQLGEKTEENKKPRRGSIPKDKDVEDVDIKDALKYLSLPRELGKHPETDKKISASIGRFGPYIVHDGDFRSLKEDDVYTIKLDRALEILKQPKKRRGKKKKK